MKRRILRPLLWDFTSRQLKPFNLPVFVALLAMFGGAFIPKASLAVEPIQPRVDEPFGLITYAAPEGALWIRWRALDADIVKDTEVLVACRSDPIGCASPAAVAFLKIVDEARALEGRAKFETVNRKINLAIRWTSDLTQYGVPELWTSPLTTFATGRGDCMDFVIAKYVALRQSYIESNDLRILIVWDELVHQHHALLAARDKLHWLILDNRSMMLSEDIELKSYLLLFSIDESGVRQFHSPPPPFRIIDKLIVGATPCGTRGG